MKKSIITAAALGLALVFGAALPVAAKTNNVDPKAPVAAQPAPVAAVTTPAKPGVTNTQIAEMVEACEADTKKAWEAGGKKWRGWRKLHLGDEISCTINGELKTLVVSENFRLGWTLVKRELSGTTTLEQEVADLETQVANRDKAAAQLQADYDLKSKEAAAIKAQLDTATADAVTLKAALATKQVALKAERDAKAALAKAPAPVDAPVTAAQKAQAEKDHPST